MNIIEEINNRDITRSFKAPAKTTVPKNFKSIFLAGSIEMDKADKWQEKISKALLKQYTNLIIFNPRRDDFDKKAKQEISNEYFYEQVDWEHQHISDADIIFIYFQKETQSPISLLELGLVAGTHLQLHQRVVVCCPKGFWRKGNVDYICKKYGIRQIDTLEELPKAIAEYLK